MEKRRIIYTNLVWKCAGNKSLWKLRWDEYSKFNLSWKPRYVDVDWIQLLWLRQSGKFFWIHYWNYNVHQRQTISSSAETIYQLSRESIFHLFNWVIHYKTEMLCTWLDDL